MDEVTGRMAELRKALDDVCAATGGRACCLGPSVILGCVLGLRLAAWHCTLVRMPVLHRACYQAGVLARCVEPPAARLPASQHSTTLTLQGEGPGSIQVTFQAEPFMHGCRRG